MSQVSAQGIIETAPGFAIRFLNTTAGRLARSVAPLHDGHPAGLNHVAEPVRGLIAGSWTGVLAITQRMAALTAQHSFC